jgi:AraC-like DNA-binding protein
MSKRLLEASELNISQIAKRAGFQTVQHFSRVFRRYIGVSPKQYRLQSRARLSSRS